jgi:hypothetical protein
MKKWTTVCALAGLLGAQVAQSDELAEAGRQVLKAHDGAVVTLQLVINQEMSMPGQPGGRQEEKTEVTGTVIDPSGLVVASLVTTDPGDIMANLMGAGRDMPEGMKFQTTIKDAKVRLADGRELPCRVVLRDKDMDLIFFRLAQKPDAPLPAVAPAAAGSAQTLDEVIIVNRMGHVAGRAVAASVARISATVEKPRKYYAIGQDTGMAGLGSPVFAADGKYLGMLALRSVPSQGRPGMGAMLGGGMNLGLLPIVVPASQIAEAAQQAPQAPAAEEKKPAAPAPATVEKKAPSAP